MKISPSFRLPDPPPWESTQAGRALHLPVEVGSPCGNCLALCCWYLVVESDRVASEADLDRLGQRLDYAGLVAWLDATGTYTLALATPCRFLGRTACECKVHQQDDQPELCGRYDAQSCWYRRRAIRPGPRRLRLDGPSWPDFRSRVRLDARGRLQGMPAARDLAVGPRDYRVPALLAFEIPEDSIEESEGLGDLLYFFSNFERCSVCRTPQGWYLLYETTRDSRCAPCDAEVVRGRVDGAAARRVLRPGRTAVQRLARELGRGLFDLPAGELALRLAPPAPG